MRIAVASRDGKSVAGHIGKCPDWIIYDVAINEENKSEPVVSEVKRVTLPKELIFHHFKDDRVHPLGECHAVIGASAGESFVNKMRSRGIEAVLTAERTPEKAVSDYVCNTLLPPKPRL